MAEGRSNAAIAAALVAELRLGGEARHQHLRQARPAALRSDHRRVLAVLRTSGSEGPRDLGGLGV